MKKTRTTIRISTDPSDFGSDLSDEQGEICAQALVDALEPIFPQYDFEAVSGPLPYYPMPDEVSDWMEKNWVSVCEKALTKKEVDS